MKKRILPVAGALVLTLGLSVSATAAEAQDVQVQLNGKSLTFTDAVPQVRDQRTFLPFRAVFEAMGAEVSNEGNAITAVRGSKTLTMTIGSTQAMVTEYGVSTPIEMDVAPYVDTATWRTYVPVRFAAQAFGCNVGWDQEAMTAILVDTDKLVDDTLGSRSFTYMEKYLKYSEKYQTGIWDTDLSFDGSMSLLGAPITFSGTAQSTTEGADKLDMSMLMKMDMSQFMALLQSFQGADQAISSQDQAMMDALAKEGIGLAMRGDLSQGRLYMNMTGSVLETLGMNPAAWYSMDLNAALAESGMDFAMLMNISKSLDYRALTKMALNNTELTSAASDYEGIRTLLDGIADFFADESFVQNGNTYTSSLSLEQDGVSITAALSLIMDQDAVVGYGMIADFTAADPDSDMAIQMAMEVGVDPADQMTSSVSMDMVGMFGLEMNLQGSYTKGTTSPVTEPPAGATVLPLENLL